MGQYLFHPYSAQCQKEMDKLFSECHFNGELSQSICTPSSEKAINQLLLHPSKCSRSSFDVRRDLIEKRIAKYESRLSTSNPSTLSLVLDLTRKRREILSMYKDNSTCLGAPQNRFLYNLVKELTIKEHRTYVDVILSYPLVVKQTQLYASVHLTKQHQIKELLNELDQILSSWRHLCGEGGVGRGSI